MALAHELGDAHGKASRCIIAYAAGGNFPTEVKASNLGWLSPLAEDKRPPFLISYQQIAALAGETDHNPVWLELSNWIEVKIAAAIKAKSGRLGFES